MVRHKVTGRTLVMKYVGKQLLTKGGDTKHEADIFRANVNNRVLEWKCPVGVYEYLELRNAQ